MEDLPAELQHTNQVDTVGGWSQLLARWAKSHTAGALLELALPEFERTLIRVALERSGGRRQDAAKLLGWGRNTLTRKIRELGLELSVVDDEPNVA